MANNIKPVQHTHCWPPEGPCDTCTPPDGAFARWCEEVVHLVVAHDRALGRLPQEPAIQYLYRCRCDEPQDAWEAGDSPTDYAAFVMNPRSGGTLNLTEVL